MTGIFNARFVLLTVACTVSCLVIFWNVLLNNRANEVKSPERLRHRPEKSEIPLIANSRAKVHNKLVKEKPEPVNGIDLEVEEALGMIQAQGDYSHLNSLLGRIEEGTRIEILVGSIHYVHSRLGSRHDLTEKLTLIEEHGGSVAQTARERVLRDLGTRINVKMDGDLMRSLPLGDWQLVARGAAEANPISAFELLNAKLSEDQEHILIQEATRSWLSHDSIAASEFVGTMEASPHRSTAIKELVKWLKEKGESATAESWEHLKRVSPD